MSEGSEEMAEVRGGNGESKQMGGNNKEVKIMLEINEKTEGEESGKWNEKDEDWTEEIGDRG